MQNKSTSFQIFHTFSNNCTVKLHLHGAVFKILPPVVIIEKSSGSFLLNSLHIAMATSYISYLAVSGDNKFPPLI